MEVIRYDKLQLDNIQYEKPENQQNVYFGPMYYDLNPFLLQSSRLVVKGIRDDGKHKYLQLNTEANDFSFYDKLVELDDYNLDQTYQKSKEWFNKVLPGDILKNMYKRITQPFKKEEIPCLEFKLPFYKQNLQTKVYNQSNGLTDLSCIEPGSRIIAMFHIKGLKFLKQNYYCELTLSQIKLIKEAIPITESGCLIEDDPLTSVDSKYDYEIMDEEILLRNNQIKELEMSICESRKKIENEQEILLKMEETLRNLK